MNNNSTTGLGGEATQLHTDQKENSTQQTELEKGSGYGPPNQGSGERVAEDDLSPDGQPIPGAGASARSAD